MSNELGVEVDVRSPCPCRSNHLILNNHLIGEVHVNEIGIRAQNSAGQPYTPQAGALRSTGNVTLNEAEEYPLNSGRTMSQSLTKKLHVLQLPEIDEALSLIHI